MWKNTEVDFQNGLKGYFNLAGQFLGFRLPFGAVTTTLSQPVGTPANNGAEVLWTNRPSTGAYDGQLLLVNDPLISPNVVIAKWNATNVVWLLEPHLFPLVSTSTSVGLDNVVTETDIASYTAQSGVIGLRGYVDFISVLERTGTTTAATSTITQYSNGTSCGVLSSSALVSQLQYKAHTRVQNQNSVASQRVYNSAPGGSTVASATTARNTNSLTLAIKQTHTWGAGGTGTATANVLQAFAWIVPSL